MANQFIGDLGIGINSEPKITRSNSTGVGVVPYANFEYEHFFARLDMFGYDIVPVGYGALEVVTRVTFDGYTPATTSGELGKRSSSIPVGIGTLQITPIGGVLFNVYRDVNQSKGNMIDALFAGEFELQRTAFYPQIGAEYWSGEYVRYFYGITDMEAARIKTRSYAPGDATNLFLELLIEQPIDQHWYLNAVVRHTWYGSVITNSPLVESRSNLNGFVALSYRFQ